MSNIEINRALVEASKELLSVESTLISLSQREGNVDKVAKEVLGEIADLEKEQLDAVDAFLSYDRAFLDLATQVEVVEAVNQVAEQELARPGLSEEAKSRYQQVLSEVETWVDEIAEQQILEASLAETAEIPQGTKRAIELAQEEVFPKINAGETAYITHVVGAAGESLRGKDFTEKVLEEGYGVVRAYLDGKEVVFQGIGTNSDGSFKASGTYGRVFFGQGEGANLVVKVMKTNGDNIDQAVVEGLLLAELVGKENVISASHVFYMEATDGSCDDYVFFVMENCDKGELFDLVKERQKKGGSLEGLREIVQLDIDAVNGLAELHETGNLHRDIKLENIFLKTTPEGKIKGLLGDVGFAKKKDEIEEDEICGTPGYIAPEMIDGETTEKSDVFSMGVTILETLTHPDPFKETSPTALKYYQEEVRDFQVTRDLFAHQDCSSQAKEKMVEIVSKSIAYNPETTGGQ